MSITGNTEMALYDTPKTSPVRSRLEGTLKACSRAKYLVQQILTFSRQSKEKRTPIQITSVVKEALKLLRSSVPTTIEIRWDISARADTVLADPTKIHQILMNLCTNAAQAMHEKGGLLEVGLTDVDLDSEAVAHYPGLNPGPYVALTVSDTGQGIDRSFIKRIFDPFFTTKGPSKGTGLGLAVVHGIVKDYGGAIDVCSEIGKGTTFRVFLPRIDEVAMAEAETPAPIPTGDERILLVDDEKAVAEPTTHRHPLPSPNMAALWLGTSLVRVGGSQRSGWRSIRELTNAVREGRRFSGALGWRRGADDAAGKAGP